MKNKKREKSIAETINDLLEELVEICDENNLLFAAVIEKNHQLKTHFVGNDKFLEVAIEQLKEDIYSDDHTDYGEDDESEDR